MASFTHETDDNGSIRILGKNRVLVATVSQLSDGQWLIVPIPEWALNEGYDFGPFATKAEALNAIEAQ